MMNPTFATTFLNDPANSYHILTDSEILKPEQGIEYNVAQGWPDNEKRMTNKQTIKFILNCSILNDTSGVEALLIYKHFLDLLPVSRESVGLFYSPAA